MAAILSSTRTACRTISGLAIAEGNTVRIDFDTGLITDETTGQQFQAAPFPPFIQQIIAKGGLMNSLKD